MIFDAFAHTADILKSKGIANTLEIYDGNNKLFGFEAPHLKRWM